MVQLRYLSHFLFPSRFYSVRPLPLSPFPAITLLLPPKQSPMYVDLQWTESHKFGLTNVEYSQPLRKRLQGFLLYGSLLIPPFGFTLIFL